MNGILTKPQLRGTIPLSTIGYFMSGLIRYIILPLCLWWLITGGYESFIPTTAKQSDIHSDAPEPVVQIHERKIAKIERPKIIKREYENQRIETQSKKNLDATQRKCKSLTKDLLGAQNNIETIPVQDLEEWSVCELPDAQKQQLFQYSLTSYRQNKEFRKALEVSSLYKRVQPNDSYPFFEEAEIYQTQGANRRSLESFLEGFTISQSKTEIKPQYFLTALKSMQRLGLVCEQQKLLTPMLSLNRLNPEVKRTITNQIEILQSKCG
jgi:hypothetical protein